MALIAITAPRSPGTTTTALAMTLTWPRPAVLVEADPAGSTLHTGYLRSRGALDRGLFGAALSARHRGDPAALLEQAARLDQEGRRLLVAGLTDPGQAASIYPLWPALSAIMGGVGGAHPMDVLVDLGRLGHQYSPAVLLADADAVLVLARAGAGQTHAALTHLAALRSPGPGARGPLLLLGAIGQAGDLPERQLTAMARSVGALYAGTVPWDTRTAAVLDGAAEPTRGLDRSALMRGAATLARTVFTAVSARPAPPAPGRAQGSWPAPTQGAGYGAR